MAADTSPMPPPAPLRLLAVGDVLIERDDPGGVFARCADVIKVGDVFFGNCEAVYADGVQFSPTASIPVVGSPENAAGLGVAGFDVMSLSNNHTVDGGHEGLLQTLARVEEQGIVTCGAGANLAAARRPAILERNGRRIAFFAYSCEFPAGYSATEDRPGIATIRTHTVYVPSPLSAFQSGGAPDQFTVVDPRDLRSVRADIAAVRNEVDLIIVSMHAGDGSRPAVITDFERQLAQAVIDVGADAYLGHHHHMLRGAEYYRGKPVFYGLGHFVFDVPDFESQVPPTVLASMKKHAGEYGYGYRDDGYPLLPMHPEARMTMIAVCDFGADSEVQAGAIVCRLNPEGQPVPLSPREAAGQEVVEYLRWLNEQEQLEGEWRVGDSEIAGYAIVELVPVGAK